MIRKIRNIYYSELEYEHRFMMSLVCAELIILLLIKLWPVSSPEPRTFPDTFTKDVVYVEKAIVTRQTSAPAAPPKPQVPVPVPNNEVVEEEIDFPEFDDIMTRFDAAGEEGFLEAEGEGELVGSPDQPPRLQRIVEPATPDAAKRANIKVRISVTFLVGKTGEVEDVFISEIRVYNNGDYEVVDHIGYGLMEATLEAATKWEFRPARHQGNPVKTYVENSFNIGF